MREISYLDFKSAETNWRTYEDCVFYNFAWSGLLKLTDGDFSDQLTNVIYSANAVKVAKKMGCSRFVNVGSLEETFLEQFLEHGGDLSSDQVNYSLCKLAARDLCRITAYLTKIDYIHTRLSVPLASSSSRGGYIRKTIELIKQGLPFQQPNNKKLFDIISIEDVAAAYYLIGKHGRNNADYFIGTSKPTTLKDFFGKAVRLCNGGEESTLGYSDLYEAVYSTDKLLIDTGFSASKDPLKDLINENR